MIIHPRFLPVFAKVLIVMNILFLFLGYLTFPVYRKMNPSAWSAWDERVFLTTFIADAIAGLMLLFGMVGISRWILILTSSIMFGFDWIDKSSGSVTHFPSWQDLISLVVRFLDVGVLQIILYFERRRLCIKTAC